MKDQLIMDFAMNLTRVGNWAADDFVGKKSRILQFLRQTDEYFRRVNTANYSPTLEKTLQSFRPTYQRLVKEAEMTPGDPLAWAESMMTWGNILTHRAKLTERA